MATLTERVKALEGKVAAVLAGMERVEAGMRVIQQALPSMQPEDVQAITDLVAMARDIQSGGLRVRSLTVANEAGDPVVCLTSDDALGGILTVCGPGGRVAAGLSVAADGSGILSILDADRRPLAALHIEHGAGQLDVLTADGRKRLSFGLRLE